MLLETSRSLESGTSSVKMFCVDFKYIILKKMYSYSLKSCKTEPPVSDQQDC